MHSARAFAFVLLASTATASLAQAPAQPVIAQQLSCHGEEPFWNLEAGRTIGVMRTAGGPKARQVVEFRGEFLPLMFLTPPAIVWRGTSTHLPSQTVVATLREESCASTMKEGPPRAWRAILTSRPGEAVTGCCTVTSGFDAMKAPLATFDAKPGSDWSRRWTDVAAAVRRCASDSRLAVREVRSAEATGRGTVVVRAVSTDGKAWTCTADASGKSAPQFAPATGDAQAAANGPVFYPYRDPPPIVACGRLERIAGPGVRARTEGWLHYDRC